MARPNKIIRFEALHQMDHVFEYGIDAPENHTGHWHQLFGNSGNIILELGCGKGTYTNELAALHPEHNYIGVDIQGERVFVGATDAETRHLHNVRYLRTYIDHLADWFAPGEVQELWITFADPRPTKKGAKKRLTHEKFLTIYKQILAPDGIIHVKIDSDPLFAFTLESIAEFGCEIVEKIDDVYAEGIDNPLLQTIQTDFEKRHLEKGRNIHYVSFKFTS